MLFNPHDPPPNTAATATKSQYIRRKGASEEATCERVYPPMVTGSHDLLVYQRKASGSINLLSMGRAQFGDGNMNSSSNAAVCPFPALVSSC